MKKLMSLALALLMVLSLAACGGSGGAKDSDSGSQPAQSSQPSGGSSSSDAKWPEKEIKIIQPWSLAARTLSPGRSPLTATSSWACP